jgi:hypothetical protein
MYCVQACKVMSWNDVQAYMCMYESSRTCMQQQPKTQQQSLFYSYLNTRAVKYGPSQMNVNSILWLQCNSICIFVYTSMHFHVYKYMKMCTCIHIQLFVLYMHMCMHMCMYGFISIFMCICKCTYMCIYLYIYLNVYVHVHVHVHVHVIGIACVSPLFVYVRVNTKSNTSHYSQLTK